MLNIINDSYCDIESKQEGVRKALIESEFLICI
jgi:hypothetical protein